MALPWTLTRTADLAADAAARTVAAFSRAAAILVSLLGTVGLLLAWRILRSWEALWSTPYGVALLTKVGLTAVVVAIATHNRFRLVPRVSAADRDDSPPAAWRLLRRAVRIEASLLVAVVAATGFLVTQSPVVADTAPAPQPTPETARSWWRHPWARDVRSPGSPRAR